VAASGERGMTDCCDPSQTGVEPATSAHAGLNDLELHRHCSVIGTRFGTQELRKLTARFIDMHGAGDLEVHHEAVHLASQAGRPRRLCTRLSTSVTTPRFAAWPVCKGPTH
jgi:hypothetical protein